MNNLGYKVPLVAQDGCNGFLQDKYIGFRIMEKGVAGTKQIVL
jgi:hypothetical protein